MTESRIFPGMMLPDREQPAPRLRRTSLDCVHRGGRRRHAPCVSCANTIADVFSCARHGECTIGMLVRGPDGRYVAECGGCRDRKPPAEKKNDLISVSFKHGLGDASNFSHMLPLYTRRGYRVEVHPGHVDHAPLFRAGGAAIARAADTHHWRHAPSGIGSPWRHNKNGWNVSQEPLPDIGNPADLWAEYCAVRLDFSAQVGEADRQSVGLLLDGAPRPWIAMHVQGFAWRNGAGLRRSYSADMTEQLQRRLLTLGGTIIMLDRPGDGRHINAARVTSFREYSPGQLYELLRRVDLLIGIDSGPLNFVRFTSTPALGIWHNHYPADYFLPRPETTHIVASHHSARDANEPREWNTLVAPDDGPSPEFVATVAIDALDKSRAPATLTDRGNSAANLRSMSFNADYYREHRAAGLDYLGFGGWQRRYGRWLTDALGWRGKTVLDVGCACGAIVRGFGQAGAIVQGIDVNEHMIRLGRAMWPDATPILHVCDAANLHLFADETFDGLHCAQVAEHWPPHLVPIILRELARVTRPGGLFFCALDTAELYDRQNRDVSTEDPTHVCVKPMKWWNDMMTVAGWVACAEHDEALRGHQESFLKEYDWDWWLWQKPHHAATPNGGGGPSGKSP